MTFVHEALYYATVDEFLTGTLDFVRAGQAAGEPTLIAVPEPRLGLLQAELGRAAYPSGAPGRTSPGSPSVTPAARRHGAEPARGSAVSTTTVSTASAPDGAGARARGGVGPGRGRVSSGPPKGIWFADMTDVGRNPARILPWVLRAFADAHPGRVRIIGEPVYAGRTADEIGPCVQHEALTNVAFAGRDLAILCAYDTRQVSDVIPEAERTHPVIVMHGRRRVSHDYTDPALVVAGLNQPMPEPDRVDERDLFELSGLAGVRRQVARYAGAAGLDPERIEDLQLAVTEICTNAVLHAGDGLGSIRLWTDAGRVVCEVRGAGEIRDMMAGRVVPSPDLPNGRGLLMANRLCDLVRTYTGTSGTITRLYMRLSG